MEIKLLTDGMLMNIYVICPVREATEDQTSEMEKYVRNLENEGHSVHFPPKSVSQNDTEVNICRFHAEAMMTADRVDIFWDVESSGSHFDAGMMYILFMMKDIGVNLVKVYKDKEGKSYTRVIEDMHRKNSEK